MIGSIEQVLGALNDAGASYLVVGGVAVVLHGHLRTTADLDLVVHLDRDNVLRAVKALSDLGYRPRAPVDIEAFAEASNRESWIRDKGLTVFSLWNASTPALEVDLFVTEPFDFADVDSRALTVQLDTTQARVIGLSDLIALKQAANRPQDQADIEALQALEEESDG